MAKDIVSDIFGGNGVVTYGLTSGVGGEAALHYAYLTAGCDQPTPRPTRTGTPTSTPAETYTETPQSPSVTPTPYLTQTPPSTTPTCGRRGSHDDDRIRCPKNAYRHCWDGPLHLGIQVCGKGRYSVRVFDTAGTCVRDLRGGEVDGMREEDVEWDGTNGRGCKLASGLYIIRLSGPFGVKDARILLIK